MDLQHLLRQAAAVEADRRSWLANVDPNEPKPCRNRNTGQRGISYVRATDRYRTFAHKPVYMYVGTFRDLDVAVQARDAAEAINTRRLYQAVPEMDPKNRKAKRQRIIARLRRRNHKVIEVYLFAAGVLLGQQCFEELDAAIDWLAQERGRYIEQMKKGDPKAA